MLVAVCFTNVLFSASFLHPCHGHLNLSTTCPIHLNLSRAGIPPSEKHLNYSGQLHGHGVVPKIVFVVHSNVLLSKGLGECLVAVFFFMGGAESIAQIPMHE